jgi:serine/threonine protein kinase
VEECHKQGILHGDLKPANFVLSDRTHNPLFSNDINLLFGEPWLLAIDFGCSQYLGSARFSKRTGTPGGCARVVAAGWGGAPVACRRATAAHLRPRTAPLHKLACSDAPGTRTRTRTRTQHTHITGSVHGA